ncbi:TraB/GumN family protein [Zoogloea sp.]|uniref:TraB/GumN family protein n=1 Tax=Zoogloea sp. TaxID=49181 RepID=UPI0035B272E4
MRWWRQAWLLLGLLVLAGSAVAKGPLYLWELSDEQGRPRAWLYGTIHVCDAGCFPLPGRVRTALAEADSLGLELDPEDPALSPRLLQASLLPAGRRLDDMLSPDLRFRLARAVTRVGLSPDAVQRMQPWMVGTLLTLQAAQRAGLGTSQGVDLWLARTARARGQTVWALETVDRQVSAMGAGGDSAQVASLAEVVGLIERDEAEPYFRRLLMAWRRGDSLAVDRMLREEASVEAMTPMLADLLDSRNREMVEAIVARLRSGRRPFIAVGAGHFGGPKGLLAMLVEKGFRVRQVSEE